VTALDRIENAGLFERNRDLQALFDDIDDAPVCR